jgi:hypothetical protein
MAPANAADLNPGWLGWITNVQVGDEHTNEMKIHTHMKIDSVVDRNGLEIHTHMKIDSLVD